MIYLDNAATTKVHPNVLEVMKPYLTEEYANAGTKYNTGRNAANAIKVARKQVAGLMKAEPEQIIFTSGGSEANNMAITGVLDYLRSIGKTRILVSSVEHDSVIKAALAAEIPLYNTTIRDTKSAFHIEFIRVHNDGTVDIAHLRELLKKDDVGLVSVMYVNNETGVINPIQGIGKICKEHNVLFHTDCVQAAGCYNIDVDYIGCDFASISSHKIHGSKGVGALFVKNKDILRPLIYGGSFQEFGLRGGTENVAGIVGFGTACAMAQFGCTPVRNFVSDLNRLFYTTLIKELDKHDLSNIVKINGTHISERGKILNLCFQNIDSETLLLMLDTKGVCVSAGSACTSHESKPSHVLLAMGLTPDEARSSVRVSFSMFNTKDEVISSAKIFAECISTLSTMML